jgi:hypothetical protein
MLAHNMLYINQAHISKIAPYSPAFLLGIFLFPYTIHLPRKAKQVIINPTLYWITPYEMD